jgi:hypothetical protein
MPRQMLAGSETFISSSALVIDRPQHSVPRTPQQAGTASNAPSVVVTAGFIARTMSPKVSAIPAWLTAPLLAELMTIAPVPAKTRTKVLHNFVSAVS